MWNFPSCFFYIEYISQGYFKFCVWQVWYLNFLWVYFVVCFFFFCFNFQIILNFLLPDNVWLNVVRSIWKIIIRSWGCGQCSLCPVMIYFALKAVRRGTDYLNSVRYCGVFKLMGQASTDLEEWGIFVWSKIPLKTKWPEYAHFWIIYFWLKEYHSQSGLGLVDLNQLTVAKVRGSC